MRTITALRRRVIREFTTEDLRIMLGQDVGTAILLPVALDVLERDPVAAGDMYPGDLLAVVLRIPDRVWAGDAGSLARVRAVVERATGSAVLQSVREIGATGPAPRNG